MHVAAFWRAVPRTIRVRAVVAICCGVFAALPMRAAAGDPLPGALDLHMVADLELRAGAANPKEQAFLYADLADKMTLLASHQMADGEMEKAQETLKHLEACTAKMESNFQQSKSLKKTEMLLHMTNRRLTDMTRAASYDMKPQVQEALKQLNSAQTSLLAVIFAK